MGGEEGAEPEGGGEGLMLAWGEGVVAASSGFVAASAIVALPWGVEGVEGEVCWIQFRGGWVLFCLVLL